MEHFNEDKKSSFNRPKNNNVKHYIDIRLLCENKTYREQRPLHKRRVRSYSHARMKCKQTINCRPFYKEIRAHFSFSSF